MKSEVYIRVDGSHDIGLGHLVRCIALAHMLKNDFKIVFVSKEIPISLIREITDCNFLFFKINEENSFFDLLFEGAFVILDHYKLDSLYQKKIISKGCKLICIDDLADKIFYADLIINHSAGIEPCIYNAQPHSQFALGPNYALLRQSFLLEAQLFPERTASNSILICFGGSDVNNLTLCVLDVVLKRFCFEEIILITGGSYTESDTLKKHINEKSYIKHFSDINEYEMIDLMKSADISIVPSSGILLEALAVGNKVISGMYIENQRKIFENYKGLNAFFDADSFSDKAVEQAIELALSSSFKNERIIDGFSGTRILKLFRQLVLEDEVTLKRAVLSDLELTYNWASNKEIRTFSFNKSEITYKEHVEWFISKIENSFYYIASWKGHSIGSIRFDINKSEAVVSYLVDSKYHERGFGIILLKKGISNLILEMGSELKKIIGFIMPANIASCRTFEKLNFIKEQVGINYKYTLLIN